MSHRKLISSIAKTDITPSSEWSSVSKMSVPRLPLPENNTFEYATEDVYIHDTFKKFLITNSYLDAGKPFNNTTTPESVKEDSSARRESYNKHRKNMVAFANVLKTFTSAITEANGKSTNDIIRQKYLELYDHCGDKKIGLFRLGNQEKDMPSIVSYISKLLATYNKNPSFLELLISTHDLFKMVKIKDHIPLSAKGFYLSGLHDRYKDMFPEQANFTLPLIFFHQLVGTVNTIGSYSELMRMFGDSPLLKDISPEIRRQLKLVLADSGQKDQFFDWLFLLNAADTAGVTGEEFLSLTLINDVTTHVENIKKTIDATDPLKQIDNIKKLCTKENFKKQFVGHMLMYTPSIDNPEICTKINSLYDEALASLKNEPQIAELIEHSWLVQSHSYTYNLPIFLAAGSNSDLNLGNKPITATHITNALKFKLLFIRYAQVNQTHATHILMEYHATDPKSFFSAEEVDALWNASNEDFSILFEQIADKKGIEISNNKIKKFSAL